MLMPDLSGAIAGLDFDVELEHDEVIADAVVIARVTRLGDGRNTVTLARSQGADEVTVAGLIECARQINAGGWQHVDGAGDDDQ